MKETIASKLAAGYHPKPHVSELMHMDGMCNTECSESMKAIGACTCDHLRCMKRWDEPKKMKDIERDKEVMEDLDPKELLKMWLEEKKPKRKRREPQPKPEPKPRFSLKNLTDEQKKFRAAEMARIRSAKKREEKERLLDAKMITMRPAIRIKIG